MKNKGLHKIYAFTLALIVLFPFTIQASHALENHEHKICTAKNVKHIHQQDADCSIYHLKIQQNSFDFSTDFTFFNPQVATYHLDAYKQSDYTVKLNLKTSRGPPYFIA